MKIAILIIVIAMLGCSSQERQHRPSVVTLYSGGNVIQTWNTAGRVRFSRNGCYFIDSETNQYISLSGTYVVYRQRRD